jgi:hypothetical protein
LQRLNALSSPQEHGQLPSNNYIWFYKEGALIWQFVADALGIWVLPITFDSSYPIPSDEFLLRCVVTMYCSVFTGKYHG